MTGPANRLPTNLSLVLSYRLIAKDNRPDSAQETQSPLIVFQTQSSEAAMDESTKNAAESKNSLDSLVQMQGRSPAPNLCPPIHKRSTGAMEETLEIQNQIKQLAGRTLADPRRPLGALKTIVDRLWKDEIQKVIRRSGAAA